MSVKIPEKFSKQDFDKLKNKKLNTPELQQYKSTVTESYKRSDDRTEYQLKHNLSDPVRKKLDFIFKRVGPAEFDNLQEIANYFRTLLSEENKKCIMVFAYNGTGKTRMSAEFKTLGQTVNGESGNKTADTLYYNAFTEDLFYWDNDLENDEERFLKLNSDSRFFSGLREMAMEEKIRPFLHRYADFDFIINYDDYKISFYRDIMVDGNSQRIDNIKVSRGEENIFVWCFFLAVVQMVVDKVESYNWVKYIYIDDPISSLDDNNVIAVASHLASLIKEADKQFIVSTHHTLFYNVMCNEMNTPEQVFLQKQSNGNGFILKDTRKMPFFYHIALLKELKKAADSGELYTYHFNILRSIMEKTASFHGYADFSNCLRKDEDDNPIVYRRIINLLSHGNYSIFEPREMVEENKEYFRTILANFMEDYKFNQRILGSDQTQEDQ